MSNIPSSEQKIQIEGAQLRAPVSESLVQTIGGSLNYLIDKADAQDVYNTTNDANIVALNASIATKGNMEGTLSTTSVAIPVDTAWHTVLTGPTNFFWGSVYFGTFPPHTNITVLFGQTNSNGTFSIRISGNLLQVNSNGLGATVFGCFGLSTP